MLKKTVGLLSLSFTLLSLSSYLEGAQNQPSNQASNQSQDKNSSYTRKFEIMEDDDREGTDIFAIPLDESDIEDQIQINQDEKKNLNDLSLPKIKEEKPSPKLS